MARFERTVILGGHGAVGQLMARLLCGSGQVTLVDLHPSSPVPETQSILADACHPSEELDAELARADAVVLALPGGIGITAAEVTARRMRRGALLAETMSVKTGVHGALAEVSARYGLEALGINPMFAPDLAWPGRPVIITETRAGEKSRHLEALIEAAGAHLFTISAEGHDQLTAALQVATHASILAFGLTLQSLAVDVSMLMATAPPPHRTMLALLARMTATSGEIYRDIQVSHPLGSATRRKLLEAMRHLDSVIIAGTDADFQRMHRALGEWLNPYGEGLAAECATIFAHLGHTKTGPAPASSRDLECPPHGQSQQLLSQPVTGTQKRSTTQAADKPSDPGSPSHDIG